MKPYMAAAVFVIELLIGLAAALVFGFLGLAERIRERWIAP